MSYVSLEDLSTCFCKSCENGLLTGGHCVDIDGDYWHNCYAVKKDLGKVIDPCPECEAGKCGNCDGDAWDKVNDTPAVCPCFENGHPRRTA